MQNKLLIYLFFICILQNMNGQSQSQTIHIPFSIDIDPMERLLLINFENDPDSLYLGFEPQVFNDNINGKGFLVIGWRKDGKVDVYHQSSLQLNPDKYRIAGKGLANLTQTTFKQSKFEVSDQGVHCIFRFEDILDREIILEIGEGHPSKRKPFGLLAPMGDAVENPSSMPLIFLRNFYFVREKHTEISILIAGKSHHPDKLPIAMDRTKMLFTRYSTQPLIATFNQEVNGIIQPLEILSEKEIHTSGSYEYKFDWINKTPAIKKVIQNGGIHPVSLSFHPAFPQISTLENGQFHKGSFEIVAFQETGKIQGYYSVEKTNNQISIQMIPGKGWKPKPTKLSLRFLYTVGKVFKKWPRTYEWNAIISETPQGMVMESKWKRIKN